VSRILVIEPHESGHHATYLRWAVEGILERGWKAVIATSAKTLEHPEMHGLKDAPDVQVRLLDGVPPENAPHGKWAILRREWNYWRMFRRAVRDTRREGSLDAVIFPYIDYVMLSAGLLSAPNAGTPWCGISMRLWYVEPLPSPPRRWRIARRLLADRNCRALFCINPSVLEVPRAWLDPASRSKLRYLPDPAEPLQSLDRAASRAVLGVNAQQLVVLAFGAISDRQGVVELSEALIADARLANYVLVVAGRQSPAMRARMDLPPLSELATAKRLRVIDRVVDATEQAQFFAAADIVWLGYLDHLGTSGVLVQAALAGRAVIGCSAGEIGSQVRRHDLGEAIDVRDPAAVRAALLRLGDAARRTACETNGPRAFAGHDVPAFKRLLLDALVPVAA
jgi:glycosyltransferase involved in cell wall biosynthesis